MSVPLYPASRRDKPHARLYDHDMNHPAWRSLNGNAFKLLVSLLASYRPSNPNSFPVGQKTVANLINVSEKTAKKLVDELLDAGHLREERMGRNRGCVKTRERVASLTRFDTEMHAGNPLLPIEVWKAKRSREKLPDTLVKKSGSENHAIGENLNEVGNHEATVH